MYLHTIRGMLRCYEVVEGGGVNKILKMGGQPIMGGLLINGGGGGGLSANYGRIVNLAPLQTLAGTFSNWGCC